MAGRAHNSRAWARTRSRAGRGRSRCPCGPCRCRWREAPPAARRARALRQQRRIGGSGGRRSQNFSCDDDPFPAVAYGHRRSSRSSRRACAAGRRSRSCRAPPTPPAGNLHGAAVTKTCVMRLGCHPCGWGRECVECAAPSLAIALVLLSWPFRKWWIVCVNRRCIFRVPPLSLRHALGAPPPVAASWTAVYQSSFLGCRASSRAFSGPRTLPVTPDIK